MSFCPTFTGFTSSTFMLNPYDTYLKRMSVTDRRGNLYNTMMETMVNFHIFSIYNVPFQSVGY